MQIKRREIIVNPFVINSDCLPCFYFVLRDLCLMMNCGKILLEGITTFAVISNEISPPKLGSIFQISLHFRSEKKWKRNKPFAFRRVLAFVFFFLKDQSSETNLLLIEF